MAAPQKEEPKEEAEDWLTTYADAITLLMAFFVMLLTFAEFDIPAYEELTSALANNIGGRDKQTTTQSLKIDVQDIVYNMQADKVMSVSSDEKGVVIELQSQAFFQPGSADLVPVAVPVLAKLAETLASPRYELYNVVVEGHTDDGAISTEKFPSNWELSTGRASAVVRLFENNNVVRQRLQAAGYADTRPKVPNRDLEGNPIPENRATNRRVVLRLNPMSIKDREEYLRAQDFKRRQEEAQQRRLDAQGPSVQQRLPIPATPEDLSLDQRRIKLALDQVIEEIYKRTEQTGTLDASAIADIQSQLDLLSAARDQRLDPYFVAIEQFMQQEIQKQSDAPQPAN